MVTSAGGSRKPTEKLALQNVTFYMECSQGAQIISYLCTPKQKKNVSDEIKSKQFRVFALMMDNCQAE